MTHRHESNGDLHASMREKFVCSVFGSVGDSWYPVCCVWTIQLGRRPVESATRFCEKISDGLIKEPVNAFSNFYIIVGLVILWNMPSKQETAPYA